MQAYLKGALPLLIGAGGQLVKRLKVESDVGGDPTYGIVL